MKKKLSIYGLLIMFATVGCGPKNSEANTVIKEIVCDCSELKMGNGIKTKGRIVYKDSLFTGKCTETDKFDSIVCSFVYEKGFVKNEKRFQRISGSYYPVVEMTYDIEGKEIDGYNRNFIDTKIKDDQEVFYVSSAKIFKDGKLITDYNLSIFFSDMWDELEYNFSIEYATKDGKILTNCKELGPPKCLPNAEYSEPYSVANRQGGVGYRDGTYTQLGNDWEYKEKDVSKFDGIIDCLKTEFKYFEFIIKK